MMKNQFVKRKKEKLSVEVIKKIVSGHVITQQKLDDLNKSLGERTHKMLVEEFGTYIQSFENMLAEHRTMRHFILKKLKVSKREFNKVYKDIKDGDILY